MQKHLGAGLIAAVIIALSAQMIACASSGDGTEPDGGATVGGQTVETNGGSYSDVSPEGLAAMLEEQDVVLVNVHIPYEGEIAGTDLFIPYDKIGDRLAELPQQRDAKIAVYCRSGSMSAIAATTLVRAGYTDVWNLDGGMGAWDVAGFSLDNNPP